MFNARPELLEPSGDAEAKFKKLLDRWNTFDLPRRTTLLELMNANKRCIDARSTVRNCLILVAVVFVLILLDKLLGGAVPSDMWGLGLLVIVLSVGIGIGYYYENKKFLRLAEEGAEEMVFFELLTKCDADQLQYWLSLNNASAIAVIEFDEIVKVVRNRERSVALIFAPFWLLQFFIFPAATYLAGGMSNFAFLEYIILFSLSSRIINTILLRWVRKYFENHLIPQLRSMCTEAAGTWELAKVWYGLDGVEKASAVEEDGEASLPEQATPS